jgi:hypothetical protein
VAQEGVLRVRRLDAEGGGDTLAEEPFALDARSAATLEIPFGAEAGAYLLEGTVSPAVATSAHRVPPSSRVVTCVVVPRGDGAADIAIPGGGFEVLAARAPRTPPVIETWVGNPGGEPSRAELSWIVTYPDGTTSTGRRQLAPIPPGSAVPVQIPTRMELSMTADLSVEITGELSRGEDANPSNNAVRAVLTPAHLPDLEIEPGSVVVSPRHPTEATTVFVEGRVRNLGARTSPVTRVGLFPEGDLARVRDLRSLAGQPLDTIPPLAPGDSHPFRVRWDPFDNLGTEAIQVVADADFLLVESDRANNVVRVPVEIRSRWKLGARGMELQPNVPARGYVTLVARVANTGETDARRVTVRFYSQEDQIEEHFIGEGFVERIPAGEVAHIPLVWSLDGVDLGVPRRPSFTVQLKGSLQRLSSVTDE